MSRRALRSAVAGVAVVALGVVAYGLEQPVPMLDWFDLAIHEVGHVLAYPLPELAMFLAGSVAQVAVPLGFAWYFWTTQRDRAAVAFCLAWAGTSARDVAVYVADAPVQALPLVGGGTHDWAFILGRLDAIDRAESIAGLVSALGLVLVGVGLVVAVAGAMERAPRHPVPLGRPSVAPPGPVVAPAAPGVEGDPWYDGS
ncbi:MAG: hypothetical protein R3290_04925 [Acidimicrobiia bacterium]|nr:hypothetical protein [Acidimicrobiia bacterium]